MKQTTFTFLFFAVVALVSCRKDKNDLTLTEYDDDQIKTYVSANGITGLTRDTSGMYYKIINPGSGTPLEYSDNVGIVYTVRSVDGKYTATDTIINHFHDFVGRIDNTGYPLGFGITGVQRAVHDLLKYKGASMRLLVPSRLGYGVSGAGTGSSEVSAGRIAGNQSLDLYIHVINNQVAYDKQTIRNFITANNLGASVVEDADGYWYNMRTPGTGTVAITNNTTITATYTARLLNGTIVDQYNIQGGTTFEIPSLIEGVREGLKKHATAGALITFIIPSTKAYGKVVNGAIPANSNIRFEVQVISVNP
ncbi:MAG: FKBP-type peptidyl-prolyl cis-trans isomerase [Bacteroidota bacterium]